MVRVTDGMIAGLMDHPGAPAALAAGFGDRPVTVRVFLAMLQALGSSSNTLIRLSDEPGLPTRDCFGISRSVVELAVNICYICAEGDSAAQRAERHAHQKAVRDLQRDSSVGSQTIRLRSSTTERMEVPAELLDDLADFTSTSGREKAWVDLSIDARCEKVEEVLGEKVLTPLHWARFAVYRHSSEILHGTFFGSAFFMGITDPGGAPESPRDWLIRISGQHLMVLMAAILALVAVARAISMTADTPEPAKQADKCVKDLGQAPFFGEDGETEPNI